MAFIVSRVASKHWWGTVIPLSFAPVLGVALSDAENIKNTNNCEDFLRHFSPAFMHDFLVTFPVAFITVAVFYTFLTKNSAST